MKIKTLTLMTIGALAVTGAANAQQRGLGRADADGDGRVSQAEFVSARTARLAAADTNGDGAVTREEGEAARQAHRAERRSQAFARLDTDSSGSISPSEFGAARPERAGRGGQRMQRQERRAERVRRQDPIQIEQARTRAAATFATLDADRDGYLSEVERQAASVRMREARQERRAERGAASRPTPASE